MDQEQVWGGIADQWSQFRQQTYKPIYDFLKKYKPIKGRILDVGCGNSKNLMPFANLNFECHGIDFSDNMLNEAKKYIERNNLRIKLNKADMTKLPFKNNFFDYVLHVASLHHLDTEEKRIKSLNEDFRVLKPKGLMLLMVWNKLQLKFLLKPRDVFIPWTKKGIKYDRYYHLFDHFELKKIIKKTKFKILESNIFGKNLIFVLKK